MAKSKSENTATIFSVMFKGSYNFLTDLELTPKVSFSLEVENNRKVFKQLSMFNTKRPFGTFTTDLVDEKTIAKILLKPDVESKKNFQSFLNIAKKKFEPAML